MPLKGYSCVTHSRWSRSLVLAAQSRIHEHQSHSVKVIEFNLAATSTCFMDIKGGTSVILLHRGYPSRISPKTVLTSETGVKTDVNHRVTDTTQGILRNHFSCRSGLPAVRNTQCGKCDVLARIWVESYRNRLFDNTVCMCATLRMRIRSEPSEKECDF